MPPAPVNVQAITSAGSGAMAALDAERYLSAGPLETVRVEDSYRFYTGLDKGPEKNGEVRILCSRKVFWGCMQPL